MIRYSEYLRAKKIIEEYKLQKKSSIVKIEDLTINQKVKRDYPESWDYWVTEIKGEDVLIRTTEKEDDPEYNDFWVNVSGIRLI